MRKSEKYVKPGYTTDDNIVRCMRFACWLTNATDYKADQFTDSGR